MADRPIPLTVVGGYLGAGKTSLVNAALRGANGRRIGLVVNDFGSLGIDAHLLGDVGAAGVIDLPNGCVCCTLGADLMTALATLADVSPPLDHVVVELSGVADPTATSAWGTIAPYRPGGTVIAVDASRILRLVDDRLVGSEVCRQIHAADLVVMTHTDLVDRDVARRVRERVGELAPDAPMVEARFGDLPTDVLLGPDRPDRAAAVVPAARSHDEHDDRYARWRYRSDEALGVEVAATLQTVPVPGLLRMKGLIALEGVDGRTELQRVGDRASVLARPDDAGPTELVAIGLTECFDPGPLAELLGDP